MNDTYIEHQKNEEFGNSEQKKELVPVIPQSLANSIKIIDKHAEVYQAMLQGFTALQRMQKTPNISSRLPETFVMTQLNIKNAVYNSSIQQLKQVLIDVPKLHYDFNKSHMVASLKALNKSETLKTNVLAVQRAYDNMAVVLYGSPVIKWIQSFDFKPILEILKSFSIPKLDPETIKQAYLYEMYDAHWFPGVIWSSNLKLIHDISGVIGSTRESKNRVLQIDRTVYAYYTKSVIEDMKKDWQKLEKSKCIIKILHQAVQAYHRKEYAVTVIVLSTQWEGIIYRKVHDGGWRKIEKTKKYMATLVEKNNYIEIVNSYFEDFIMYHCKSSAETIVDVPGRHPAAHGFYETYPTKKAALNAILFTDFLLRLEPLEEKEYDR